MGDSNDSSEDDDICWQVVTSPKAQKRRQSESPKMFISKRQNRSDPNNASTFTSTNNNTSASQTNNNDSTSININNMPSTSHQRTYSNHVSHNRFSSLRNDIDNNDNEDDIESETDDEPKNNLPKPPPIIIPNVADIKAMIKSFSKQISPSCFTYKTLRDGQIRIMVKDIQPYRILVTYLNDNKINFHTYQYRQEKAYRAVIKNLHPSTPNEDIKNAIESLGHKVRNVTNIRRRNIKEPLPMFFIDLEPSPNNKNIYDIKYLNNAVVNIVPPKKTKDLVQCHRCQEFGHTKTYCRKQVHCVKCGLGHLTTDCNKDNNAPPRCVNCLKNHAASYKGCEVYRQLLKRKLQDNFVNRRNNVRFSYQNEDYPYLNNNKTNSNQNNNNFSYSDVLKNNQQGASQNSFEKLESLIQNQIELTNKLLSMMTVLITKLCN